MAGEKDLPIQPFGSKAGYDKVFLFQTYNNNVPPYDEKHIQMSEQILKELQLSRAFGLKYGLLNENLFNYALANLLYCIHQGDIVEKWEVNDARYKILAKVEQLIRNTLKKISLEEEVERMIFYGHPKEHVQQKLQLEQPDFEQYYNLMANLHPVGNTNNQEGLSYIQKRQERILMMCRCRHLLAKLNVSMGLITRALYVYKYAITHLVDYSFDKHDLETGEEPQNQPLDSIKPQSMQEDKKQSKAKDDKKQPKQPQPDAHPAQPTKFDAKLARLLLQIAESRKYRRTVNAFWFIRLRVELLILLYRHNRYAEALSLIDSLKQDIKTFNDTFYSRVVVEYHARILLKQGKLDDSIKHFEEAIAIGKQYFHADPTMAVLYGDYAELLHQRKHFEEANQLFQDCYQITQAIVHSFSYTYGFIPNDNLKAQAENIQICQELCLPLDVEQELLKKTDHLLKPSKKDDKKNKDEAKSNKKGPDKGQSKGPAVQDKPSMKIHPLSELPNY